MEMLKAALRLVHVLRRVYWWAVRPQTRGVRAIVVRPDGCILLVKHRYEDSWFLPGGKVRRGESDGAAVARELREEVGLKAIAPTELLGTYRNEHEYKRDVIAVFVTRTQDVPSGGHFEIEAYRFVDPRTLPEGVSSGTVRRIAEWLGEREVTERW